MERLLEMSTKVLVYCRKKLSCRDSRLNNLDDVFTCFHRSPLHITVISNDMKFARNILYSRSDLALKEDNRGWTPLHLASARGSLHMVELLLNAEPNACEAKDEAQRTPLHLAAMNDRVEIMEVLMEEGLPKAIHLKNDQNGESILHFCVKNNSSMETLELLVDKLALARTSYPNITINSEDNSGKTVLHLAAEMGKTEMVHYLLESSSLKLEITNADFAEALKALPPESKKDLQTRFFKHLRHDIKKHNGKPLSDNGDDLEWMKDRVNALMVVATLIAGIAFQAAMNPPGGVWQEDSKVKSSSDPVTFAYYLDHMFASSVSGSMDRYITKYLRNSTVEDSSLIHGHNSGNVTVYIKSMVKNLRNLYINKTYRDMAIKGLILEDFKFTDAISDYNNSAMNSSHRGFSPYLIRYAGYPILAYTYPANYVIYIVTNGVALFASLAIILLVVCGFMIETFVTQVRFLVWLMCISIGCIAFGYMSILHAMLPDFYIEVKVTFIILQVLFGVCCILGAGLFIWNMAWKIVKLQKRKRHHHVGVINHLEKVFFGMDATAAGTLILFTVSYFALRLNGFLFYEVLIVRSLRIVHKLPNRKRHASCMHAC